MNNPNRKLLSSIIGITLVGSLFIAATVLVDTYSADIERLVGMRGALGMSMYVGITIVGTVAAPVSTLPLLPLAISLWGWFATALLSIVGWVIGSQIAFLLARRYGKTLIQKFVSLDKLASYENYFTKRNIFWSVVFLRMIVPVDVLSYALGLFSTISSRAYFLATILGVTPFAFIFSFTGSLSPGLQLIILIEVVLLLFLVHHIRTRIKKNTS